jgi:hypothetical protein
MDERVNKSRYSRSDAPAGMAMQYRDRQIMTAVHEYRFLTRSQIQRLFNINCVTRANVRLRKLFDHGYLDRRFRPTVTGTSESIYVLGNKGIPIVAQMTEMQEKDIASFRRLALSAKEHSLEHDLLVNDFRISIVNEIKKNPNLRLVRWLDSRGCGHRFEVREGGKTVKSTLRPDGYFQMIYREKLFSFFVEIDRSTSSQDKLRTKFQTYLDFKNLGLYEQAYNLKTFYVLVATNSLERRHNLKKIADELSADIFWFGDDLDKRINWLTEASWLRSGSSEIRVLLHMKRENR